LSNNLAKFMAAARSDPNWHDQHDVSTERAATIRASGSEKVLKQGVAIDDVYQTIQAFMAGCLSILQRFRPYLAGVRGSGSCLPVGSGEPRQFYVRNNREYGAAYRADEIRGA